MDRGRRPTVAAALVAALALWLIALVHFREWIAHNDFAIFRLNLEQELDGRIRTVGAFSRLGVYHPGPLREWVFALPYRVSGTRASSLPATALVLNVGWIGWTACVLARRPASERTTGLVGLVLVVLALGPDLASPWNPHLAILPMYLALWGAVDVVTSRGTRWAAPVLAASFAAQMHASALPLGGFALAGTLAAVVWFGRDHWHRVAPPVVTTLVLWSGPLVDLRRGRSSNLARMVTVRDDGTAIGFASAIGHVSRLLWPPTILRHQAVATSGRLLPGFTGVLLATVVVVLVVGVVRRSGTRRVGPAVGLVAIVGAVVTGALFVEPNYRYLYGPLQAAAVFALVVSAMVVVSVAWARRDAAGRRVMVVRQRRHILQVTWLVAAVVITISVVAVPADDHETAGRRALGIEPAVTAELDAHPEWSSVAVVDLGQEGASIDAELADIVYRSGRAVRSGRFGLGLDPPTGADPVLAAAMGDRLACLATIRPPVRRLVSGVIASNGLPVGVFVVEPGSAAADTCLR